MFKSKNEEGKPSQKESGLSVDIVWWGGGGGGGAQ